MIRIMVFTAALIAPFGSAIAQSDAERSSDTVRMFPSEFSSCYEQQGVATLGTMVLDDEAGSPRDFYNGQVRIILLDSSEPAMASVGFAVLFPEPERGFLDCRYLWPFTHVDLAGAAADYDPARGLTVTIPTATTDVESVSADPGTMRMGQHDVRFRINLAEGSIEFLEAVAGPMVHPDQIFESAESQ